MPLFRCLYNQGFLGILPAPDQGTQDGLVGRGRRPEDGRERAGVDDWRGAFVELDRSCKNARAVTHRNSKTRTRGNRDMVLKTWIAYLVFGLFVMPLVFRIRFGRWPFAVPLIPRNRYDLVEHAYALAIVAATLLSVFDVRAHQAFPPGWLLGLTFMVVGVALQVWSVFSLGSWWRIGQDPGERVPRVRSGPYRWVGHPIYVSLSVIVLGEVVLCGFDSWWVIMLVATVVYGFVQGPLESRRLVQQSGE